MSGTLEMYTRYFRRWRKICS